MENQSELNTELESTLEYGETMTDINDTQSREDFLEYQDSEFIYSPEESEKIEEEQEEQKPKTEWLYATDIIPEHIISYYEDESSKETETPDISPQASLDEFGQPTVQPEMETVTKSMAFGVARQLMVRQNKYNISPSRIIRMTEDFHKPFYIIENDIDCTPKPAIDEKDSRWMKDPLLLQFLDTSRPKIMSSESILNKMELRKPKLYLDTASGKLDAKVESTVLELDNDEVESYVAPTMFPLKYPEIEKVNRMRIVFTLTETETITLLTIISKASDINDEEGGVIKKVNALQETVHKRLRKSMNSYCQTTGDVKQRIKETQLSCNIRYNKYSLSSNWDRYDSIKETAKVVETPSHIKEAVGKVNTIVYADLQRSAVEPIVGKNFIIKDRLAWYRADMIMERVLLSNNALKRQLLYHDRLETDPLNRKIKFKYNLQYMWTLKTQEPEGLGVTCMAWHPHAENILAVGYGMFDFTQSKCGIVRIWNNKNLAYPERTYKFQYSVTSLKFSKLYPNILAISFCSGWVIIINIEKQEIKIIARNMPANEKSMYPVHDIAWKYYPRTKRELIFECTGNGVANQYIKRHLYEKKPIMKISKMKGKIKGIPHPRKCQPYVIPLVRNPAILCIVIHPVDNSIYMLGSEEGGVYKCSLQDAHQYTDMFIAHNGPVYTIQYHPACSKIFLTCGADWCVRVWGDGIFSPLLTMSSDLFSVQHASWSPNQPTIIVAVTATRIELWDISRRIVVPQATYENPKGEINTFLSFSAGGNLCVGDKAGNIHVYILSDMPFIPANSDMVLALILLKALTPNLKLLSELIKLGPPFNVPRMYKNYLNLT